MRTNDPVADMEKSQEDRRPIVGYCEVCGCELHGGNDLYDADEGYEVEHGVFVCEDHLKDYFYPYRIR